MSEAGGGSRSTLDVVVVSPARELFNAAAKSVTVPTWNKVGGDDGAYGGGGEPKLAVGTIGILPGHADLVAAIGSGVLKITRENGGVLRLAVRGGFLKVGEGKVTILVDHAMAETDATADVARRELEETLAALKNPKTDEEFAELLDRRAWSESQLKLLQAPSSAGHHN
jgi:F-type H+-transporting ATPase subunit epsilon